MERMELTEPPFAHTSIFIRKPVSEVFEALEHGLELNLVADRFPKGIDRQ